MKKILTLGFILFAVGCQPAAEFPTPVPQASATPTIPPTPVPPTETPVPTPSPEPTATPLPRFFTDEFDGSLGSWFILQAGNEAVPNVKTENSTLTLQMDAPFTWAYAVFGAQNYDNIRVDARFANQAGSPSSIGLLCRYSETDGWFEYNISTDGTYNVLYGQWLADGVADYLPILSAPSNAIQPSGSSQEIGLLCSDSILSLYIDQNLIRNVEVSRYELTSGKVGVTASSFENIPVIAAFDWVRVSEP